MKLNKPRTRQTLETKAIHELASSCHCHGLGMAEVVGSEASLFPFENNYPQITEMLQFTYRAAIGYYELL